MLQDILLGDEAVARGAIDAGISGGYSYPGTPATEIVEYLYRYSKKLNIHAIWSANEKVAYEEALGMSYAGKRALVAMKHVGLNVAADPFMNSAVTGVNGGLVLAVADDPGMHSSQNEQDSRYYANFGLIICLEPTNNQEAYEMTREAFDLSEKFNIPIMIRLVTRLAHCRANVKLSDKHVPQKPLSPVTGEKSKEWILLPANAKIQYKRLSEKQDSLIKYAEESKWNNLYINEKNTDLGIIATGLGYSYLMEFLRDKDEKPSILKLCAYPAPLEKIKKIANHVDRILVVEDGYPFIEARLRGIMQIHNKQIMGKLSGEIPLVGELTPEIIAKALGVKQDIKPYKSSFEIPPRPPILCKGCSHVDTYKAINAALDGVSEKIVFGDIGCYTLGALPPFEAINSCVDMGASIGMAKGAADSGAKNVLAVIGDSTFGHSGMTPLLGAAYENTNMTVFILDNRAVAMTGGQEVLYKNENTIYDIVKSLGVDEKHIKVIEPLPKNHESNVKVIKEEIAYKGLSVIIPRRECVQTLKR